MKLFGKDLKEGEKLYLGRIAGKVSPTAIKIAQGLTPAACKALLDDSHPGTAVESPIQSELLYLTLHIASRMVEGRMTEQEREYFLDALVRLVAESQAVCQPGDNNAEMRTDAFLRTFQSRHSHYATYKKLLPEADETFRGTLLWDFGSRMGTAHCSSMNPVRVSLVIREVARIKPALELALEESGWKPRSV